MIAQGATDRARDGGRLGGVAWTLALTACVLGSLQLLGALEAWLQPGASDRARALGKIASAVIAQGLVAGALGIHLRRRGERILEHPLLDPGRARGWVLAAAVLALVAVPNLLAAESPPVLEPSAFNLVGSLLAGTGAGTLEELLFRGALVAALARRGLKTPSQLLLSSAAFGLAHAGWSLLTGNLALGAFAVLGTALFGALFGAVYLAAGRRLLPAVVLHASINLLIEPWLVLAALEGELGLPTAG